MARSLLPPAPSGTGASAPAAPRTASARTRRVVRGCLAVIGTSSAVLTVSGLWLSRYYRPSYRPAPPGVWHQDRLGGGAVHEAHVCAAIALTAAVGVVLLVLVAEAVRRRDLGARWKGLLPATLAVGATVAGFVTSKGLRWGSLALWAVTIGSDYRGVWRASSDEQIRFLLIPGVDHEVTVGEYRRKVIEHLVVAPLVLAISLALLTAAVLPLVRRETSATTGEGPR